ncbi:MAG: sigma-70 family RNA polymerase sigma factor [Acaryochloris sp. CRU_2_0]|nr:sigma-70 family RNA polymerase sigma factor [Acaryochloris sp. CRU_2_0]
MTQTQFTQATQSNPDPNNPLTPDEEWALVAHVQARTQLLKDKKEGLTLDEKRICLRGERALKVLVDECQRVIWAHIYRSNFSHRIPIEEMYQLALMCVEQAANNHNPNKPGKQTSFKNWVSLQLRRRLIDRFDKEFRYHRRGKAYCDQLIHTNGVSDGYTPIESACNQGLREKLERIINDSLPDHEAKLIHEYYLRGNESKRIAASLGITAPTVMSHIRESRKQLRDNPQIRELAGLY